METFGERLARLRNKCGLSQAELARQVGWTSGYVSLIEANKRLVDALPRHDYMLRLAEVLEVSVEELAGETLAEPVIPKRRPLTDDELFDKIGARRYDPIELIEGVAASAGPGAGIPQDIDDTLPRRKRRRRYDRLREITVIGQCMEPDLCAGDLAIIDREREPKPGKIVVAVRDEEELLIKRLALLTGQLFLVSNIGDKIAVDEHIRILGSVVGFQRALW